MSGSDQAHSGLLKDSALVLVLLYSFLQMERLEFKIEQDGDADVFVASWDDPAGGGITTQAKSLAELHSAIQESVRCHFGE